MKLVCLVLMSSLVASLFGCATSAPPSEPSAKPVEKTFSPSALDIQALTGVEVNETPVWQLSYPVPKLYQPGAVLPTPEGLDHLERLALWLQKYPLQRWQVTVNAQVLEGSTNPELVAAKRQELLIQFFKRKGLNPASWDWQVVAGGNYQLLIAAPEVFSSPAK